MVQLVDSWGGWSFSLLMLNGSGQIPISDLFLWSWRFEVRRYFQKSTVMVGKFWSESSQATAAIAVFFQRTPVSTAKILTNDGNRCNSLTNYRLLCVFISIDPPISKKMSVKVSNQEALCRSVQISYQRLKRDPRLKPEKLESSEFILIMLEKFKMNWAHGTKKWWKKLMLPDINYKVIRMLPFNTLHII